MNLDCTGAIGPSFDLGEPFSVVRKLFLCKGGLTFSSFLDEPLCAIACMPETLKELPWRLFFLVELATC